MSTDRTTTVDFIAQGDTPDEWRMVLVEEGPWSEPISTHLRRLQDRLYGAIDAALGGQLAEKFPQSIGKKIAIELNAYNLPTSEVGAFFDRFSKGVLDTPDYRGALSASRYVSDISFRVTFESIN